MKSSYKKTWKSLLFFRVLFPGASGCPAHPERQSRVSPQVPAQTRNGVAKVSLSFNPPNLADITPQLRAAPCHRKQSGMDHCTQPLSSSFFVFNLVLQVSVFFSGLFLSSPAEAHQGQMIKGAVFPASVSAGSGVCLLDSVFDSLEMPSPPSTPRSLWRRRLRSQTFWKRWTSAGGSARPTPRSRVVS